LSEIPFVLPIVFGVSLLVAVLIFLVGRKIAPKGQNVVGKTEPYACGETITVEEAKVDLERFLTYAVYFLVFDVFAFVIVTSFYNIGVMPIVYSLVVLMAVAMLIFPRRKL
jgi:NADH:ubiquinone oxidoreductase subunit 3 (subunit A)